MPAPDFETAVKQEVAHLKTIHPTPDDIPSCMKLIDDFLICNVITSQMKSLYRYGHMSECAQKMEDFKFCMSNKSMESDEKYEAWIRRRAEWWAKRRLTKSSEEVWDMRTEPITDYPSPQPDLSSGPMFS